jgi:monoamine oxidase
MAQVDALVIGAGAAGLAAAHTLSEHGLSLAVLEARDRIGGRIFTTRPSGVGLPVELGAEFVHGRPRETFAIVRAAGLTLCELDGDTWSSAGGKLSQADEEDEEGDEAADPGAILAAVGGWRGADQSFQAFLDQRFSGAQWATARRWASGYVEGYETAVPDQVSVRWLAQNDAASASIDGDRQFRVLEGYDRLLAWLRDRLNPERAAVHLSTVVQEMRWSRGVVEVSAQSPVGAALPPITARAAIVTLPLGVLTAPPEESGAVRFVPEIPRQRAACDGLAMGQVVKVVLRFREPFWEDLSPAPVRLPRLSFLLSDDAVVPTWWSSYPLQAPILTGWVGGPRAARLASQPDAVIADEAIGALARALSMERRELEAQMEAWHLHNWSADPFARGAYSYGRVGGLDAPRSLGEPVDGTLFFAGEATNGEGHSGTVHGALAMGRRAADQVLAQLGRGS